MGYYTQYNLRMKGKDAESFFEENKELISAAIAEGNLKYDYYSVVDACFNDWTCKWYDHELHMLAISRLFPDEVFYLKGVGEGDGEWADIWISKYQNGTEETKDLAPRVELDDIWGDT
jgi:uncharacterized phage protein (TIGR02220 family)